MCRCVWRAVINPYPQVSGLSTLALHHHFHRLLLVRSGAVVWSSSISACKMEYLFLHMMLCHELFVSGQMGQTRFHSVKHFRSLLKRDSVA